MDKKRFKRLLLEAAIFIGLVILTFWLVFKDQDLSQVVDVLKSVNLVYIFVGLAVMVGYFAVEAWNVRTLLKSLGEEISFKKAMKFTLIGFFFCSVTPGASGGQPLEVYYMSKDKIPAPKSTMAILVQTCGIQFAVMTMGVFFLIFKPPVVLSGVVLSLFALGLLANGIALVALMVCIFSPQIAKYLVNAFLKFLKGLGFKKLASYQDKVDAALEKYSDASQYVAKHPKEFWKAMGRGVLQMTCYYLIPFFVYRAFGLTEFNAWQIVAMQSILFIATSGLPIPGAVGASESVFLSLYGVVFGTEILSSALLLNRGINFYWFVIVSMVVVLVNSIRLHRAEFEELAKQKKS